MAGSRRVTPAISLSTVAGVRAVAMLKRAPADTASRSMRADDSDTRLSAPRSVPSRSLRYNVGSIDGEMIFGVICVGAA